MTTFNRLKLRRLVEAGKVTATSSYRFDDQYGAERGLDHEMPVRIRDDSNRYEEGVVTLHTDYFSGHGRAREAGTGADGRLRVVLYVHSNLNYTFAINPRPVPTRKELEAKFAATVDSFQHEIRAIADAGGLHYLDVFKLWRDYADAQVDQSALLSEFREHYAQRLGLKQTVVVQDASGSDTYKATPDEASGLKLYLAKHVQVPARALARIWFNHIRDGIDLLNRPLPNDLRPANVIPITA